MLKIICLIGVVLVATVIYVLVSARFCPDYEHHHCRILRTEMRIVAGKAAVSERVREWHLKIPQEFRMHQHRKWEISPAYFQDKTRGAGNNAGLRILGELTNTGKIVPMTNPRAKNITSVFSIRVRNDMVHNRFLGKEFCVPEWQYSTVDTQKSCRKKVNCSIYLSYSGWPVGVSVRNDFAIDYAKYCDLARKQLDLWTVRIDDLRTHRM